jgi:protein-tyrosine phosphatase
MAAGLLSKIAKEKGINVDVRTAGLAYHPNKRVAQSAVAVMEELGIDISDEYSKPVTAEGLNWADVVLTVQRSHKAHLLEDCPSIEQKLRLLESDVRDPYCGPIAEYRNVRDQLKSLLAQFVLSLEPR